MRVGASVSMKSAIIIALVCAVLFAPAADIGSAAAADPLAANTHVVVLSREDTARLGIATTPALRTKYTPQVRGYGVVISLSSIAQADSEFRTAEAAATDSDAHLQRAERLFAMQALSAQVVDTARHQAAADQAALILADRKEAALFGQHAPWRGPPRNEDLLNNIAAGDSTLVQATFPLGIAFPESPTAFVVTRLDPQPGQKSWSSNTTWDAPADPAIPGRNFFALVEHSDLALGEHVLVFAPIGAPIDGVSVPLEAVVLHEDKPWCYVTLSEGHYRRVPIDLKLEVPGGYFVPSGILPGQLVVTKGTGLLLAREVGAATLGGN